MQAGNYCTRGVITVDGEDSTLQASRLMREHHVGSLVVVSRDKGGDRPLGVLTDRDIVIEVLAGDVAPDSVSVKDIMTPSPVLAREDDGLTETLESMRTNGVRRMPVTDAGGQLVGMLSLDDVLGFIYESLGNVVSLLAHEQMKEQRQRPATPGG